MYNQSVYKYTCTYVPARGGGRDAELGDVLEVAQLVEGALEGGAIPRDGLEGVGAVVSFCFGGGLVCMYVRG